MTQRFVDAWMAFPGLLLLLTIMSIAGRGMLQIIIVLGVSGGIPASRVVRGATHHLQHQRGRGDHVGGGAELGGMLSREGRRYMEIAPHLALWPGACLTVVVYSLNMFGDAVRDLLDPRLRGRLGRYGAGREERGQRHQRRRGPGHDTRMIRGMSRRCNGPCRISTASPVPSAAMRQMRVLASTPAVVHAADTS